jgi:hypothetical protein
MTVSIKLRDTRIEFTYDISDAPALTLRYRTTKVLPTAAKVDVQDGQWRQVRVQGANAKKDGSPGANVHYEEFYPSFGDPPAWVLSLAEQAERRYAAMTEAVTDA